MAQGLGKMNSDTLKAEQMICHSKMVAVSSSQGDQRSTVFLCMGVSGLIAGWGRLLCLHLGE